LVGKPEISVMAIKSGLVTILLGLLGRTFYILPYFSSFLAFISSEKTKEQRVVIQVLNSMNKLINQKDARAILMKTGIFYFKNKKQFQFLFTFFFLKELWIDCLECLKCATLL